MNAIYLDHNATTPTRDEVIEAMVRCYRQGYANPASQHRLGQRARRDLESARDGIAEILGADLSGPNPDRVILTSGGTEANCMAVLGMARARLGANSGRVVISSVEHPSVVEPAQHLARCGWQLDRLDVTHEGVVRTERLPPLLTSQTGLVSVMLGNHETGVLQPVAELATTCREAGVPMHADAIAVAGKLPINFRELGVDALSVAAHKFQGPLGIGALILRAGVCIEPLLFGGHQQSGIRPGTESIALAVGMHTALELWQEEQEQHVQRLTALRDRLEAGLQAGLSNVVINGSSAERLPHVSNIAFPGLDGQILLVALDTVGVACSVGSACSSGSTELSPTLNAMGLTQEIVSSSLRFSIGATTTEEEIDEALWRILQVVGEIRSFG